MFKCDIEEACKSDLESRRSSDNTLSTAVPKLQLCDTVAYTDWILCGGTAHAVCGDGYYRNQGTCEACPSKGYLMATGMIALVALTVALTFVALGFLLAARPPNAIKEVAEDEEDEEVKATGGTIFDLPDMAREIDEARGYISLLLGYIQVISQLPRMFTEATVPWPMWKFTSGLGALSLDLNILFNGDCIWHHIDPRHKPQHFWQSFYQALLLPWFIVMLAALVYAVLEWKRRKRLATSEHALSASQSACISMTLFVLVFIHPGVSTGIFQLFNCFSIYHDETSYEYPCSDSGCWYIFLDSSVQCYTSTWWNACFAAVLMILLFVIGYPTVLVMSMCYCRQFHKVVVKVPPEEAYVQALLRQIDARKWRLVNKTDSHILDRLRSLVDDPGSRNLGEPVVFPLYITAASFTKMPPSEDKSIDQNDEVIIWLGAQDDTHVEQSDKYPIIDEAMLSNNYLPIQVQYLDDKYAMGVLCQKTELVNGGNENLVPVTLLDAPMIAPIMAQFYADFEDRFFFWQCYEICRRLFCTSMVIVVDMAMGEAASIEFAVMACFVAIYLHKSYSPYQLDGLDTLQSAFLANQFVVDFLLLCIFVDIDADNKEMLGYVLVTLQIVLMIYTSKFLYMAGCPIMDKMKSRTQEVKDNIKRITRNSIFGRPRATVEPS